MKYKAIAMMIILFFIFLFIQGCAAEETVSRDIDGDGFEEYAIDANNDTTDGYEVFSDTHADSTGNTSKTPSPLSSAVDDGWLSYVDGDGDGKKDHFIATCGCAATEIDVYWDPDEDILTEIPPSYHVDVNNDGTLDIKFDSDGDGTADRWLFINQKTTNPLPNQPPVADAGGQYNGVEGQQVTFDGGDSYDADGTITNYTWDFGDGSTGYGRTVGHTYTTANIYIVTLTVEDNDGLTNISTATAVISEQQTDNTAPNSPAINGPETGSTYSELAYNFSSTDEDGNDLTYAIEWGDGTTDISGNLPSGYVFHRDHTWYSAGKYTIVVTVSDGQENSISSLDIYIDALPINGLGLLLDDNSDGTYDSFQNQDETITTTIESDGQSCFLLDANGDSTYDYRYNLSTGSYMIYTPPNDDSGDDGDNQTPGFEVLITLFGILLAALITKKK